LTMIPPVATYATVAWGWIEMPFHSNTWLAQLTLYYADSPISQWKGEIWDRYSVDGL